MVIRSFSLLKRVHKKIVSSKNNHYDQFSTLHRTFGRKKGGNALNRTMITATNTLAQLQKQVDIIAHNMANLDTTGYKRREATFNDLLVQHFNNQPNPSKEINRYTPNGIRQGVGAKLGQVQMIGTQGNLKTTDRPLDVAFTKERQYFGVHVEDENNGAIIRLTRDGSFYFTPVTDDEVTLVTGDGYLVLDETNNPIQVRANPRDIAIHPDGQLQLTYADGTIETRNLMVYQVHKPQFLVQLGNNLIGFPENSAELGVTEEDVLTHLEGPLRGQVSLQQGVLEQSNADMSKEMTELINAQRAIQFQSRTITLADQMMGLVNGIR